MLMFGGKRKSFVVGYVGGGGSVNTLPAQVVPSSGHQYLTSMVEDKGSSPSHLPPSLHLQKQDSTACPSFPFDKPAFPLLSPKHKRKMGPWLQLPLLFLPPLHPTTPQDGFLPLSYHHLRMYFQSSLGWLGSPPWQSVLSSFNPTTVTHTHTQIWFVYNCTDTSVL
ncbi:Hypothetical predicted protein [Podarcis lilfordi]|uniref:Uncharacterized protein n=1 Tax=Podarcis lilfordi TaxID=74358 RepID=A0AA35LKR4_9SAUR|nr:Hypothetical predicted protein [Podarcis lilfordi]